MPAITCYQCGGPHLTKQCLASSFADARHSSQPKPKNAPQQRPRHQKDWMLPQHEQLLDLLETPATLIGKERDFVLAGVTNGPYKEKGRANSNSRVVVGPNYKLYIDGQLIHHGSLWSTKDLDFRHREHMTNCVKDSRAWSVRRRTSVIAIDSLVDKMVDEFGVNNMYVRKHAGKKSVKVFAKGPRSCEYCYNCDAYDFLNKLLDCSALHGPRPGWDGSRTEPHGKEPVATPSLQSAPSQEQSSPTGYLSLQSPDLNDVLDRVLMERTEDGFSVELLSFKNHSMLYGVLLVSDLGRRLTREGVDIKPNWANGAKVLFPTRASALPSDLVAKLRPYHVLARAHDVPEVLDALRSLSYKQAPRHSGKEDDRVPLSFVIDKTFVRVPEPCELTPRSSFTKSTNDAQKCYTNPRARDHRFDGLSFAGAASSGNGSHVARSFQEHLAEMKICQAKRDLHLAIQCYSQMLADELQPDVQVFTIIIDLCAKTGNCEEAERWIRTMKDNHVKPNVVSFNCLISGYAHLGKAANAEEWYQELLRAELHPSLVTYNCLIKAFTQSGCVERAEEWLKTAEGTLGSDTLSYAPFIEYFAHKGLPRKAEEWFNRMGHHGLAPDSETFGMMVAAAANAKDLELARVWADRMQEAGHQLQVYEYTQLLKACCPHDDSPGRKLYDEASAVFHDQVRSGVTPNLFNLNALQSAVGRERALVLCERLQVDVEAAERKFKYMKEELGVKGWMIGKIGKDGAFRRKHSAPDYEHAE